MCGPPLGLARKRAKRLRLKRVLDGTLKPMTSKARKPANTERGALCV